MEFLRSEFLLFRHRNKNNFKTCKKLDTNYVCSVQHVSRNLKHWLWQVAWRHLTRPCFYFLYPMTMTKCASILNFVNGRCCFNTLLRRFRTHWFLIHNLLTSQTMIAIWRANNDSWVPGFWDFWFSKLCKCLTRYLNMMNMFLSVFRKLYRSFPILIQLFL